MRRLGRELGPDLLHGEKLGRALDHRMAGKDLLDQGGAGSLQPDDEDRVARIAAAFAGALEQGRVERFDRTVDEGRGAHLLRREAGGADPVGLRIMAERLLVAAAVLERLAEREMQVERVGRRELPPERLAHRRKVAVVKADRLEVREAPPAFAIVGPGLDRLSKRLNGIAGPARIFERRSEAHPQSRVARLLANQLLVDRDFLVVTAEDPEQRRLEHPDVIARASGFRHLSELFERPVRLTLLVEEPSQSEPDSGRRRTDLERAPEQQDGLARLAAVADDLAQLGECHGIVGLRQQMSPKRPLGVGRIAGSKRRDGLFDGERQATGLRPGCRGCAQEHLRVPRKAPGLAAGARGLDLGRGDDPVLVRVHPVEVGQGRGAMLDQADRLVAVEVHARQDRLDVDLWSRGKAREFGRAELPVSVGVEPGEERAVGPLRLQDGNRAFEPFDLRAGNRAVLVGVHLPELRIHAVEEYRARHGLAAGRGALRLRTPSLGRGSPRGCSRRRPGHLRACRLLCLRGGLSRTHDHKETNTHGSNAIHFPNPLLMNLVGLDRRNALVSRPPGLRHVDYRSMW